jgi:Glutathione S-transferase
MQRENAMSIVVFEAPSSSASPVTWALAELNVPHHRVRALPEIAGHASSTGPRLAPDGSVPTLVVNGTPMFDALSILTWLGDSYGVAQRLWPAANAPHRREALTWSTWAYVMYGAALHRLTQATRDPDEHAVRDPAAAERARGELDRLLKVLDARLTGAPYLLGQEFSLADLIVSSVVRYGEYLGATVEGHANVRAWLERCQTRPKLRELLDLENAA